MAQIANRDEARNASENAKDHVKDATDKATEAAKNTTQRTAEAGKQATDRVTEIGRQTVERGAETAQRAFSNAARVAGSTAKVESDYAKLFVELASEQLQHQAETVQRLLKARDLREITEIQSGFVRESLSRMAHAMNYQLELGNAVTSRMLSFGRDQVREAA